MGQTLSSDTAPNEAPIFSLPAALVQSIMHFCSVAEIIALARCSTRLYCDGGQPFAWKHATISINADHVQPQPTLLQRMYSSSRQALSRSAALVPWLSCPPVVHPPLLAHARISLPWTIRGPFVPCAALHHGVLALLDRIPAVHTFSPALILAPLRVSKGPTVSAVDAFCLVLRHPAMRSLTSLHLYEALHPVSATKPLFDAISALPSLSHLSLNVSAAENAADAWEAIALCPALTSLHVHDYHAPRRLKYVPRCPRLTALNISMPWALHGDRFRPFFLSEHMRRLVKLQLDWLYCAGRGSQLCEAISPDDFAEVFASMTRLEEIQLIRVYDVDALLPHLGLAPALRLCVIQPKIHPGARSLLLNSAVPAESVVRSLLDAVPALLLRLALHSPSAIPRPVVSVPPTPSLLGQLSSLIAVLKQSYPQRFEVVPGPSC